MQAKCVMAVSATLLQGLYGPRESFAWLRQQPPSARVGTFRADKQLFQTADPLSRWHPVETTWQAGQLQ